jgi:phage shock protein PspC (stress-responsive transcriptional regulator)
MSKKRAFVRYSKQGKIVPGSLILTSGSHPNGPSTWSEVPADLCCNTCKSCLITSVITGVAEYYDCNNVLQQTASLTPGQTAYICASRVVPSDNYTYTVGEPCLVVYEPAPTTTTTTTTSTTSTTSTTTTTTVL